MRIMKTCAFGLVFCLSAMPALAATGEIARVVAMTPYAEAEGPSGLRELALKTPIFESDEVRTGEKGMVQLIFNDDTTMTLDAGSVVAMTDFGYGQGEEPSFAVDMSLGLMRMITGEVVNGDPEAFSVKTPHGTIGIRGTGFSVAVSPDNTLVTAFQLTDGREILVKNDFTGEMTQLKSTSMAVIVGPEGSQLIPLPALPAVDSQFIARPSLSGIQNGANPDDGLGGSDREDALLDFGQIAVPGMGQDENGSSDPTTPTYSTAEVSVPLSGMAPDSGSTSKIWNGELTFTADLGTGAASNASFSVTALNDDGFEAGSISASGGSGTASNGSFSVDSFSGFRGAFEDLAADTGALTQWSVTSGTANFTGSLDTTDAENTGKGSGVLQGGSIFLSGESGGTTSEYKINMPYFSTAKVTVPLLFSFQPAGANNASEWDGTLTFDADVATGATSNGVFTLGSGTGDVYAGSITGTAGVDMSEALTTNAFVLGGFELGGSFTTADGATETVDPASSSAQFAGSMTLDPTTGKGEGSLDDFNRTSIIINDSGNGGSATLRPIN